MRVQIESLGSGRYSTKKHMRKYRAGIGQAITEARKREKLQMALITKQANRQAAIAHTCVATRLRAEEHRTKVRRRLPTALPGVVS